MSQDDEARRGRRIALTLAGLGLGYVLALWLGGALGLSQRSRALIDLAFLAGFGWALWTIYALWRDRRKDRN